MEATRSGAAVQATGRRAGYYDQARPEVAALVPEHCRRVLDVGCAGGELGRLLKAKGHHVTGIELVPAAAVRARRWLDHVESTDVETTGFPFAPESFDAIVFADVLEHLLDPWRVLREAVPVLASGGCVIASIPNLQNFSVLRRLVFGRWKYRERGITEFGHLRFFTLQTIRHLFAQAGLEVTDVGHRFRRTWFRSLACVLTAGWAKAYLARQYLVVGTKRSTDTPKR